MVARLSGAGRAGETGINWRTTVVSLTFAPRCNMLGTMDPTYSYCAMLGPPEQYAISKHNGLPSSVSRSIRLCCLAPWYMENQEGERISERPN